MTERLNCGKFQWSVIYYDNDTDIVTQFVEGLIKASQGLRMNFSYSGGDDVAWVEVPFYENIQLRQGIPRGKWSGGKFVHCIEEEM